MEKTQLQKSHATVPLTQYSDLLKACSYIRYHFSLYLPQHIYLSSQGCIFRCHIQELPLLEVGRNRLAVERNRRVVERNRLVAGERNRLDVGRNRLVLAGSMPLGWVVHMPALGRYRLAEGRNRPAGWQLIHK